MNLLSVRFIALLCVFLLFLILSQSVKANEIIIKYFAADSINCLNNTASIAGPCKEKLMEKAIDFAFKNNLKIKDFKEDIYKPWIDPDKFLGIWVTFEKK